MRQIAPYTMKCFLLRCATSWFTVRETVSEDQREYFNIHTHRNLGIPNRAIQSKSLSRRIGVTKHIRIGVTGVLSDNVRQEGRTFFFWGSYWKDSTLKASSSACRTQLILHRLVDILPALNDRKVVVCLSLLYQLLVRTSWKFIHLFRRHVLHSFSSSRNSPFMSCTWAWTFSFIWIFFLADLDKEYRQSPDRYSFHNVKDVVLHRRLKGSLSCWFLSITPVSCYSLCVFSSVFKTSFLTRCPKSFKDFTGIFSVPL